MSKYTSKCWNDTKATEMSKEDINNNVKETDKTLTEKTNPFSNSIFYVCQGNNYVSLVLSKNPRGLKNMKTWKRIAV